MAKKKYIRSLARHFSAVSEGSTVILGFRLQDADSDTLQRIGLGSEPEVGTRVVPASLGRVSHFNAAGKELIRRDLPLEKVTREQLWTRQEWRGRETVEVTDIVDIPYKRYPRDYVPAPLVELEIVTDSTGQEYAVVDSETYDPAKPTALLHKANLMLELFGDFEILQEDLSPVIRAVIRRVNWEILPPGTLNREQLTQIVRTTSRRATESQQRIYFERFDALESFGPDEIIRGHGGFNGYMVFAYHNRGLYILESPFYGNATYVLDGDWERISQLTKAEVLKQDAHKDRIIHNSGWNTEIRALFAKYPEPPRLTPVSS